MSRSDEIKVPVTIHLDGLTFQRIARAAENKGTSMRNLIEQVLTRAAAPTGPHPAGTAHRLSEEERGRLRTMILAGEKTEHIARVLRCHPKAVAYWRRKLRGEAGK